MSSLGKPFFYQCAWYVKRNGKRVYLFAGTDAERAAWKAGKRAKAFKPSTHVMGELRNLIAIEAGLTPATQEIVHGTTVAEAVRLYLADCKNRHLRNFKCYQVNLNSFAAFQSTNDAGQPLGTAVGDRPLSSITPTLLRQWRAANPTWKSSSYARNTLKLVLMLCNWAVREQLITVSPLVGFKLPKEEKRETIITEDEETEILNHSVLSEFKAFFQACLYSGRRPNEVAGLTRENVHTQHGRIAWRIKGKNFSKTGKYEVVPLSLVVAELTRAAKETAKPGEPLFPNSEGGKWNEQSWNDPLRRDNLDINPKITMYACRHTYITRALGRGVPIAVVAHLVGNSVQTLLKHYAHVEQTRADLLHAMAEKAVG